MANRSCGLGPVLITVNTCGYSVETVVVLRARAEHARAVVNAAPISNRLPKPLPYGGRPRSIASCDPTY